MIRTEWWPEYLLIYVAHHAIQPRRTLPVSGVADHPSGLSRSSPVFLVLLYSSVNPFMSSSLCLIPIRTAMLDERGNAPDPAALTSLFQSAAFHKRLTY